MSTEEYPEVSGDESGIVPSQSARPPEWPKKIRTLTASELDRLTIDSSGRFYWDGKLVNYEPPEARTGLSAESREQSALDMLDRAVHDLSDNKTPSSIEGATLPGLHSPTDFDIARMSSVTSAITTMPIGGAPTQVIHASENFRLKLSRGQALAVAIALLAFVTGAVGVAAYGYVAMRDWNCRIDSKQTSCPAMMAAKPIARPAISD